MIEMKNVVLALGLMVLFSACETEEVIVEEKVIIIEEQVLDLDDIKALKMEQAGVLFESAARQPEFAASLAEVAEKSLYKDYTELLPLIDKNVKQRGIARGYAIGKLIEGIARQPELNEALDKMGEQFIGVYNDKDFNEELMIYTRAKASSFILIALARQPEARPIIDKTCLKYLNISIGDWPAVEPVK